MITGLYSAEIIQINNQEFVLSSISDITERKRIEEEREKLIGDLKEALSKVKTVERFYSDMGFLQKDSR